MNRDCYGQRGGEDVAERWPTGVPGLDRVLEGGLRPHVSYLISGGPGTGKTVLASQIAFAAARRGQATVFVSILTESYASLMRNLRGFSFFDECFALERVEYVASFAVLETEGLGGFEDMLRLTLRKRRPAFLILDNVGTLRSFTASDRDHRALLRKIVALAHLSGTTIVATSDVGYPSIVADRNVFDAIVELHQRRYGLRTSRLIEVVKSRGAGHLPGAHEFEIRSEGVHVYPRLEATPGLGRPAPGEQGSRPFGVATLDRMLQGGLPAGSTTAVVGPSGVGKTLLALSWLHQGLGQGERALYYGFHEPPGKLLAAAQGVGLDLEEGARAGRLELEWLGPGEASLDRFGHELIERVERFRPSRVVVDSIGGLILSAPFPERIAAFLSACTFALRELGATALFTVEGGLFGGELGESTLSASFENLVELRFRERADRLERRIVVRKTLGSGHDPVIRTFTITSGGFVVEPGEGGP